MSVDLHCGSCGKLIQVPREKAGTWGKCPTCDADVYIPTPEDEIEELPLAPEDTTVVEREEALKRERLRMERMIAKDESLPAEPTAGAITPDTHGASKESIKLSDVLNTYLIAMRDANLAGADEALAILLKYKKNTRRLVERLSTDQIPPPSMADVPLAVYQGFLRNLRSQL